MNSPIRSRLPITEREEQILHEISRDWSTATIAKRLGISEHTVRTHVKNTMRKVHHRAAAVAVLYRDLANQLLEEARS